VVETADGWALEDESGRVRGWAREMSADRPAWAAGAYGFELDIDVGTRRQVAFTALPGTPPVERDLALVLPPALRASEVETVVRRVGGALLERAGVFDEYRAEQLAGRGVGWRLVFRAPDRTLRDEEVDTVVRKIVDALKEELDVQLRES
jgi:phenylalanyl-tRNA synthetase beta chain